MLKSLEIVNNRLYWLRKNKATGLLIEEPELEQIKQDLEVLEIIRKSHLGDDDIFIRFLIASYMDIDEYNKIKQWLLSNKVGDNHD